MLRLTIRPLSPAMLILAIFVATGPASAADPMTINPRSAYPEGPLVRDGALYYAEMGNDRVMRWRGGSNEIFWFRRGCGPTAVAQGPDKGLVVLCHREGSVARVGAGGETLAIIRSGDGLFDNPNAATGDGRGGVYFSSSGRFAPGAKATGAVLYLAADGRLIRVAEGIHYANGVALAPDRRTLFVSEHLSRRVLAYDVAEEGTLSGGRTYVSLDELVGTDDEVSWEVGPDGLAVDDESRLYIAEYGAGRVLIVDGKRDLVATIPVPERYTTGVALSQDRSRLYITAPSSMFADGGAVHAVANPAVQAD